MSSRKLLLLPIVLAACGGGPALTAAPAQPAHNGPVDGAPRVVRIDGSQPAATVAAQIGRAVPVATGEDCYLLWGDPGTLPGSVERVHVEWGTAQAIDGWIVCGNDAKAKMEDPRLHQIGILEWDGGRLRVGHPSGPGRSPIPEAMDPELEREARQTFGLFDAGASQGPAGPMLEALVRARPFFLFIMWPVGAS